MQDLIPTLTISSVDNLDESATFTIQVKDAAGNNLAQRFSVNAWVSSSEYGGPAAETSWTTDTGTLIHAFAANAHYSIISDANGVVEVTIAVNSAPESVWLMAEFDGRIYTGIQAVTSP